MPHNLSPNMRARRMLAMPIEQLRTMHLRVHCGCGREDGVSLGNVLFWRGGTLADTVRALRCRKCQAAPKAVDLLDDWPVGERTWVFRVQP